MVQKNFICTLLDAILFSMMPAKMIGNCLRSRATARGRGLVAACPKPEPAIKRPVRSHGYTAPASVFAGLGKKEIDWAGQGRGGRYTTSRPFFYVCETFFSGPLLRPPATIRATAFVGSPFSGNASNAFHRNTNLQTRCMRSCQFVLWSIINERGYIY